MFDSRKHDDPSLAHKGVRHQARHNDSEGLHGAQATGFVGRLMAAGIDGMGPFDSVATVVARARARSGGDAEKAVDRVVSTHLTLGGASGFVTSIGGFVVLPVSLPANVAGFHLLATRMAASIAALRGYDLGQPPVRSAVLLCLVGADAGDVLAKAGVTRPSGHLTSMATQQLPAPALVVLNKAIGFRILMTTGRTSLTGFGRAVPLVGGAIGGGLDTWLLHRVARTARRDFPPLGRQITTG